VIVNMCSHTGRIRSSYTSQAISGTSKRIISIPNAIDVERFYPGDKATS